MYSLPQIREMLTSALLAPRMRHSAEPSDRRGFSRFCEDPNRPAVDPARLVLGQFAPIRPHFVRLSHISDMSPRNLATPPRMRPLAEPGDRRDFSGFPGLRVPLRSAVSLFFRVRASGVGFVLSCGGFVGFFARAPWVLCLRLVTVVSLVLFSRALALGVGFVLGYGGFVSPFPRAFGVRCVLGCGGSEICVLMRRLLLGEKSPFGKVGGGKSRGR